MVSKDLPAGGGLTARPQPGRTGYESIAFELLPFLRRLVQQRYRIPAQDGEDVLQDAIVDFLVQARRCERAQPGLLVVIARRRCADYWRRCYADPHVLPLDAVAGEDPRHPVVRGDEYADGLADGIALAHAWPVITARCRQYLARRFWKLERARDIANSTGDRPETVKRFMSRCLAKLRTLMEEPA
jgi:DNA-directed RNA polymerase specialized sigma24 family protein